VIRPCRFYDFENAKLGRLSFITRATDLTTCAYVAPRVNSVDELAYVLNTGDWLASAEYKVHAPEANMVAFYRTEEKPSYINVDSKLVWCQSAVAGKHLGTSVLDGVINDARGNFGVDSMNGVSLERAIGFYKKYGVTFDARMENDFLIENLKKRVLKHSFHLDPVKSNITTEIINSKGRFQ